ncbi:hypothetical protein HIM_00721 [Hirsutella minnesotensis 3608]|nr:hypothetical protein HIM_00721 [Hirsutella minnesotensis 3608]
MSTQGPGIPLHHRPDAAGYRLLELPPEVVSMLEADDAPVYVLDPALAHAHVSSSLTVAPASPRSLTLESSDSSAVLKTPAHSYALRQKNTSNALLLLSPHSSPSSPEQGLSAISTLRETVELEVITQTPVTQAPLKDTGSRGKWHERFGKNR